MLWLISLREAIFTRLSAVEKFPRGIAPEEGEQVKAAVITFLWADNGGHSAQAAFGALQLYDEI